MVSVLAFYSTEVYSFNFCRLFEKNGNEQKEAGDWPFKNVQLEYCFAVVVDLGTKTQKFAVMCKGNGPLYLSICH